jgi:putative SOS response-associated peptidase YedK
MCARFALTQIPREIAALFGLVDFEVPFPPRYNIAPTQPILVVRAAPRREAGSNLPDREAVLARWGLLPSWLKDMKGFPLLINARSETATTKNAFRAAMRHRRVLVPASGFYEWKRDGKGKPNPFWIRPRDGSVVAFGGLMETWLEPGGSEIDTAAILTTGASAPVSAIHDRMPVVIRPEDQVRWLDCVGNEPRDVADAMTPVEDGFFEAVPVSTEVNKVASMGAHLQDPIGAPVEPVEDEVPRAAQMRLF